MNFNELRLIRGNLDRFVKQFDDCIKTQPSRKHLLTYVGGQLSDLERKSVEPIALEAGVAPRTLQEFLELHQWDQEAVRRRVQELVMRDHAHENAIAVVDETGCPKKGDKTAGVQRQYCGATGKTDNCVVTVQLGYTSQDFHAHIDSDLYVPEKTWHEDRQRCREAGIPEDVVYRPKWRIALDLLERSINNGVRVRYLTADELYGRCSEFRRGVARLGLIYVVEVPCSTMGWTRKPRLVEPTTADGQQPSGGRQCLGPKAKPARRVDQLWNRGGPRWQLFHVKNSEKGPIVWQVRATRFYVAQDDLPTQECWLMITRNVLTGEVKYFLSNAPKTTAIEVLVHIGFSRWHIERLYQDAKGQIGFDHFEVQKYPALIRHLILSLVSMLFLMNETKRLKKKSPWWSAHQVREVVEAQLDPTLSSQARSRCLEKVAKKIDYTQRQRERAARSHRKKRLRELHALGIRISVLPKCFGVF